MKAFHEKADNKMLAKCRVFVEENINSKGDYNVYISALSLYVQLRDALIKSHKEFDDAIISEINKNNTLEDDLERFIAKNKFNQINYYLYPDIEAHNVLEQLDTIEKNNRNK